ncbi:MAG TPA: hypothetical protein VLH56_19450 [Dissulfurispiraceae bacterium]|nr:hypothetical protein [Dissulfurispiraceae bacterium]
MTRDELLDLMAETMTSHEYRTALAGNPVCELDGNQWCFKTGDGCLADPWVMAGFGDTPRLAILDYLRREQPHD